MLIATWCCGWAAATLGADATAAPEGRRAFDVADVYGVAQVQAPALAPDRRRVAFAVKRFDVAAATSWSELWLVGVDGAGLRQLTFAQKGDHDPQWTPDGAALLFLSNRSGSEQLWTLAVDGGEPRQLTRWPGGVSAPRQSRDGRFVAVTSEVWPDLPCAAAAQQSRDDAIAAGKFAVRMYDSLLYRHWSSWEDGKVAHVLLVDARTGEVVRDLTPGPFDSPPFVLGGGRAYDFSPDGRRLVFMSNHDPDPASSTNSDLFLVELDRPDAPVNLTDGCDGWDGLPLFSPDGKTIAYVSQQTAGYESDLKRVALLELSSRRTVYLTERGGFDQNALDLRFAANEPALFFQAEHHGRTPLFRLPLGGGAPKQVHTHASIDGFELLDDHGSLVYARRGIVEPHELCVKRADATAPTRLTRFNAAFEAAIDLRPAQELWLDGDVPGSKVHTFVITPHGFDPAKKYPLILNVHGGPQSQFQDAFRGDWQVYPGKGCIVAFCNPTGSTGYGQEFCDAIGSDWGGRVYRDLMKVTDQLCELPWVDRDRLGAMGWSYGGYMMMWMQGHTDRFKCQVAMMGLYDLRSFYGATEELWFPERDLGGVPWHSDQYERWSPSNFVHDFRTPALVITGEQDYRVPYTQSLQYFTALQERGVESRLVVFPDAGHWPGWQEMLFYYGAHVDWFARFLASEPLDRDLAEWARTRRMPARAAAANHGS
ncbi:MAG: S9 family peptidase [Planctomycetes bacterium]|nr:S9 family peptidase [Planctomycetota bacterium]